MEGGVGKGKRNQMRKACTKNTQYLANTHLFFLKKGRKYREREKIGGVLTSFLSMLSSCAFFAATLLLCLDEDIAVQSVVRTLAAVPTRARRPAVVAHDVCIDLLQRHGACRQRPPPRGTRRRRRSCGRRHAAQRARRRLPRLLRPHVPRAAVAAATAAAAARPLARRCRAGAHAAAPARSVHVRVRHVHRRHRIRCSGRACRRRCRSAAAASGLDRPPLLRHRRTKLLQLDGPLLHRLHHKPTPLALRHNRASSTSDAPARARAPRTPARRQRLRRGGGRGRRIPPERHNLLAQPTHLVLASLRVVPHPPYLLVPPGRLGLPPPLLLRLRPRRRLQLRARRRRLVARRLRRERRLRGASAQQHLLRRRLLRLRLQELHVLAHAEQLGPARRRVRHVGPQLAQPVPHGQQPTRLVAERANLLRRLLRRRARRRLAPLQLPRAGPQ
eukprot:Rhum_TRINITY_DN15171_c4_g5::Rhum_TRINITY_DN15171_c4_g5_i1::g.141509::m.141509